jgi:predicted adenine nucleotide alpha hydrolase (AANH) superfamily ATPase
MESETGSVFCQECFDFRLMEERELRIPHPHPLIGHSLCVSNAVESVERCRMSL